MSSEASTPQPSELGIISPANFRDALNAQPVHCEVWGALLPVDGEIVDQLNGLDQVQFVQVLEPGLNGATFAIQPFGHIGKIIEVSEEGFGTSFTIVIRTGRVENGKGELADVTAQVRIPRNSTRDFRIITHILGTNQMMIRRVIMEARMYDYAADVNGTIGGAYFNALRSTLRLYWEVDFTDEHRRLLDKWNPYVD